MASERAKKTIYKMRENGGIVSRAMRDAGFSKEYARHTEKFKNTKVYKDYISRFRARLSEDFLIDKHEALLNKKETIARNNLKKGIIEIIRTGEIDPMSVFRGLDMAYKVRGDYAAEKIIVEDELSKLSDAELRE